MNSVRSIKGLSHDINVNTIFAKLLARGGLLQNLWQRETKRTSCKYL